MANPKHLAFLKESLVGANRAQWDQWRCSEYKMDPVHGYVSLVDVDLAGADLHGPEIQFGHLDLAGVNLQKANLVQTNFHSANLRRADLRGADLRRADLRRAILDGADLNGANLQGASLCGVSLVDAKLNDACLHGADLSGVRFQRTALNGADLSACLVYGVSVWDVELQGAVQNDLVITPSGTATVTVDNLEIAQFLYLLLNNASIRGVIDTITSKAVLILGRFTKKRKPILDAIRDELRKHNYLPIVFDFDKPTGKSLTETVLTLANLSRFIIADITSAKSIPQELAVIVPNLPSVPVQPLLAQGAAEYGMFEHFKKFPWVLKAFRYKNQQHVVKALSAQIIAPAEAKAQEHIETPA